jgi:hypothetical protein
MLHWISLVKDGDHDPMTDLIQLRGPQKLFMGAEQEASQMTTKLSPGAHRTALDARSYKGLDS